MKLNEMPRKRSIIVVSAFLDGRSRRVGNTRTDGKSLYLHNNEIARMVGDDLYITNAGWFSATTKDRLNALPGVDIVQKSFNWYLNGKPWDGDWTLIKPKGDWEYKNPDELDELNLKYDECDCKNNNGGNNMKKRRNMKNDNMSKLREVFSRNLARLNGAYNNENYMKDDDRVGDVVMLKINGKPKYFKRVDNDRFFISNTLRESKYVNGVPLKIDNCYNKSYYDVIKKWLNGDVLTHEINGYSINNGYLRESVISEADYSSIMDALDEYDMDDFTLSDYYQEGMTFDEFDEAVRDGIHEYEVIGYRDADKVLHSEFRALDIALELADEYGYTAGNLNSELLATIYRQHELLEEWERISDEVRELFEENDEYDDEY